VFPVRFDRYSPYFAEAKRYGLDLRPFDFYGLIYPFDAEALGNIAYHFVDQNEQAAYVTTWKKWIEQLREKFGTWTTRWHGRDGRPAAQLFLQPGVREAVVYDSRGVDPVEHRVGEGGRLVLARLSHPLRAADVAAQLRELDGFDPEAALVDIERRRLVF